MSCGKESPSIREAWGQALRERRMSKRLTMVALAFKAEISVQSLRKYEHGIAVPSVIRGMKLVDILGWTVEDWADASEAILERKAKEQKDQEIWDKIRFPWEAEKWEDAIK